MFNISDIPNNLSQNMIKTKVWQSECPLSLTDLRLVTVEHYNFNKEIKLGHLVTAKFIAEQTLAIFKELYNLQFPINKIVTIDEYAGDDELSMQDNNSSCFNYRKIAGSANLSMHAYGLAIDINPLQNPFIAIDELTKQVTISPPAGVDFLNRRNLRPGMLESIIEIFVRNGLKIWGGTWNTPIDYHHFQVEREIIPDLLKQ